MRRRRLRTRRAVEIMNSAPTDQCAWVKAPGGEFLYWVPVCWGGAEDPGSCYCLDALKVKPRIEIANLRAELEEVQNRLADAGREVRAARLRVARLQRQAGTLKYENRSLRRELERAAKPDG